MRFVTVACLVVAQLLATPSMAAAPRLDLRDVQDRMGAFVGARLQVPLGSKGNGRPPLLGLAVAPSRHGIGDAKARVSFGDGVAIDLGQRRPELRLGGVPLAKLPLLDEDEPNHGDFPDEIAIAGGVLLVGLIVGYGVLVSIANENSE